MDVMLDPISSLDTSRTTWRIKVRVTRMWPSLATTADTREPLKGYNLILLDEDNNHIQAFVFADKWKFISKDIVEGGLYVFSNFYTREATGTLRPTSSEIVINFSNTTTIQKIDEDDFMIPNHKFEFVDLGELFSLVSTYENPDSPKLSTDIIGVLEDFEDVKPIQTKYGDRQIARFRITDGRYSHKVSVWGQLAVTTNEMYNKIEERPIIAIVTSTKMKLWKSTVQISTLPSSKIYLNMDNEFVNEMKIRLEEEGYKASEKIIDSPVETPVTPPVIQQTITVKELIEKNTTADLKQIYLCRVKVATVEEEEKWWYLGCTKCYGEAVKPEGKFRCSRCTYVMPVPLKRFKVIVLAGDATEALNFVMLDKSVKRIVGETVTKMIADNPKSDSAAGYPKKLKDISGMELTFSVMINEDNVSSKSQIYEVIDAYDKLPEMSSPSHASVPSASVSTFSGSTVDLSSSGETPGTGKSTTKKIKTEK